MKNFLATLLLCLLFAGSNLLATNGGENLTKDFSMGDPQVKSMNALAFGPQGILFIGDSQGAWVIAIDTKDDQAPNEVVPVKMEKVDETIAAMLGTNAASISIQDMAVNPVSKAIYLAVHLQDGTPVLMRTDGEDMKMISLEEVLYSKVDLTNAIAEDATDRRGRSQRHWAVSDIAYYDGQVMVSGLSNEAFSSTFRRIPFPFNEEQTYASLEIYHAAHGRYETYAPIKTFMPYKLKGKAHLVASYTCTPLVIFPMDDLKPGQHSKGKTVAELGNRNTPLDIVSYEKEGKSFILMANTSRALMKIDPEKIETYQDFLTEPVDESSATAGVEFIALPYVLVQQMDKLDDSHVLLLQRMTNGDLQLHTVASNRL